MERRFCGRRMKRKNAPGWWLCTKRPDHAGRLCVCAVGRNVLAVWSTAEGEPAVRPEVPRGL